MAYIHAANIDLGLKSPLDEFIEREGIRNGENTGNIK